MTDIAPVFPSLPAVSGKKVSAAFDGGRITSDGGVLLLASTRAREICARLASLVTDGRDPTRTRHSVADMFFARSLAIAAGYEDADDLDDLRHDPAFKMALGKAPGAQIGLVSQPTMSRWESHGDVQHPTPPPLPHNSLQLSQLARQAYDEPSSAAQSLSRHQASNILHILGGQILTSRKNAIPWGVRIAYGRSVCRPAFQ